MDNTACHSESLYRSLAEAKTACSNNDACIAFYDLDCDGGYWHTCFWGLNTTSSSSCAWKKGNMSNMLSF